MTRSHASPHAKAAADAVLARLAAAGHPTLTLDEAIHAGLLTDQDWCDELQVQREKYGVGTG
ncbi:hypothetical protein [Deinococcus arenicola]|uniref:Antitoxin VbhA domain-containing protein n=1 Tax=Deinococcus arenicola TaxID=2994950 RepID=A0ABU4DUW8_9DEIO|nr:hypothetical protein [Deinococcus sp. ZS9-10]MDV6376231.1 hypothetical protein [Deinococcus sp. ZS9-10]